MADSRAGQPTRRSVLDVLLGTGLVGWVASIIYPVLRYMKPVSPQDVRSPIKLAKDDQTKLEKEHQLIVRAGPTRLLVFEDAAQSLRCVEAKCTHEGCTVQYVPGDSVIWCACHNGKFDLDGKVIAGPPPRPLKRWEVVREADGAVVVSPGSSGEKA
jgi:Rieske Fe-S protein